MPPLCGSVLRSPKKISKVLSFIGLQKSQSFLAYVLSRRQSWCSFLSLCIYTTGSGRWGSGVDQANGGEGALPVGVPPNSVGKTAPPRLQSKWRDTYPNSRWQQCQHRAFYQAHLCYEMGNNDQLEAAH